MDEQYVKKYVEIISNIFLDKISKMDEINPNDIDYSVIKPIIQRAALNFLTVKYNMFEYEEIKKMDRFQAEVFNVDGNWYIGTLQCFTEDLGLKVDITRYVKEDLSDLTIKLFGETYSDETIIITDDIDGTDILIKNGKGQSLRCNNSVLAYREGNKTLKYDETLSSDLHSIIQMYRNGKFSQDLNHSGKEIELPIKKVLPRCIRDTTNNDLNGITRNENEIINDNQDLSHI